MPTISGKLKRAPRADWVAGDSRGRDHRDRMLPFAMPDLDHAELEEFQQTLQSGRIADGIKRREFEAEFARQIGVKQAVAVRSGSDALLLALNAIGARRGDEIVSIPLAFGGIAEAAADLELRPVFIDVEPQSLNMNPDLLVEAIGERTRAIVPMHVGGLPSDLERIHAIARRSNLPVVENAFQAFPATYHGHRIGCLSDVTCFSFQSNRVRTIGQGGVICTNSEEIAERCRSTAELGFSKIDQQPPNQGMEPNCRSRAAGLNFHMNELAAGIGLAQLRKAERMWQRRRQIAMSYNAVFSGLAQLECAPDQTYAQHAWQLYLLRLNERHLTVSREQFIGELRERNIEACVHLTPLDETPAWQSTPVLQAGDLPVISHEHRREVSLPIYSRMSDRDAQDVIDAVCDIVSRCRV